MQIVLLMYVNACKLLMYVNSFINTFSFAVINYYLERIEAGG